MSIVKGSFEKAEFVGRKAEIDTLMNLFKRVKDGVGTTVFLEGEAGVGKTALFDRFEGDRISQFSNEVCV